MKALSLFTYILEKRLAIPTSPLFHFTMVFMLQFPVHLTTPSFFILVGGVDWWYWWVGRNLNDVSQCTTSYGASKASLSPHSSAKTNDKSKFLRKNGL